MDIFGTKKLTKTVNELSETIAKQNEKISEQAMELKAARTPLNIPFRNFGTQIFPHWRAVKEQDAFKTMDMIYSIVSKLATAAAMVPFLGFDKKKNTDLNEKDKLVKFLDTLGFEEKEKMFIYLWLCGEVFMLKNKIELGVNKGLQSVSFLHPARVVVVLSETFPVEVVGYIYFDAERGVQFNIPVEDVVAVKFFNPTPFNQDEWRGLSPIKVLARVLTMTSSIDDAATAQVQNGGVPGIVYDKTPGLAPDVIGQRRDNFGKFLRNSDNKGAPYFSANELGYLALGTKLSDMEIEALSQAGFERMCNAYGVSSVLFNNKQASTESNVQEMIKEMYTSTIMPNVIRVQDAMNKGLLGDIETTGVIKADFTNIKPLQDDMAKKVTALKDAWWLTGNEKREEMTYDNMVEQPLMDEILIPTGLQKLEDLDIQVEPVVNVANEYNNTGLAPVKRLKDGTNY